jgi:hypothetical protein
MISSCFVCSDRSTKARRARMAPGHDMFHKTTRITGNGVHSTQFAAFDKGLINLFSSPGAVMDMMWVG